MTLQSATPIAHPTTTSENRWTLHREAGDEWCSLAYSTAGWTLSITGGEFTVLAEGGDGGVPDVRDVHALRSRLRALGWNETAPVTVRLKADRRREVGADRPTPDPR
jgi:hypothetical protein